MIAGDDVELADRALDALAVWGPPRALAIAAQSLRAPSSRRRAAAVQALAQLDDPGARELLRYVLLAQHDARGRGRRRRPGRARRSTRPRRAGQVDQAPALAGPGRRCIRVVSHGRARRAQAALGDARAVRPRALARAVRARERRGRDGRARRRHLRRRRRPRPDRLARRRARRGRAQRRRPLVARGSGAGPHRRRQRERRARALRRNRRRVRRTRRVLGCPVRASRSSRPMYTPTRATASRCCANPRSRSSSKTAPCTSATPIAMGICACRQRRAAACSSKTRAWCRSSRPTEPGVRSGSPCPKSIDVDADVVVDGTAGKPERTSDLRH